MTNRHDDPQDPTDDSGARAGSSGARGPTSEPGREPGRGSPPGRSPGEGPGEKRARHDEPAGDERANSETEDVGAESTGAGPAGGEGSGRAGHGGRGARRAWGDAFSEVQDLVGEVVGDVLEGVRDAASTRFPRMDLVRIEGEGYRLLIDLPGLTRREVEVLTLGNELTIRGERSRPELPEGSEILRSERAHGHFERTIRLPPEVREEGVAASFEDGVLTVRLPRAEPSDARPVDIS